MVRVMDAAGIAEDLATYPLMHFIGGNEPGVWLPVVGGDEVNWRIWPSFHPYSLSFSLKRLINSRPLKKVRFQPDN